MINNNFFKEEFINSELKSDPNLQSNYVASESLKDTVIIGSTIINDFKYNLAGDFNLKNKYKLGDVVKFKDLYYVNLFKGNPVIQTLPNNPLQWKKVKIDFNILEQTHTNSIKNIKNNGKKVDTQIKLKIEKL
jgi:hypothetical protein